MNAIPSAVTQTLGINGQPSSFSKVLIRFQTLGIVIFLMLLLLAHPVAILMGRFKTCTYDTNGKFELFIYWYIRCVSVIIKVKDV